MVDKFLKDRGFTELEGNCYSCPLQVEQLRRLTTNSHKVMEIGFNGGHSAEVFLSNPQVTLTSFDLGMHNYVYPAKSYIDKMYPNRHTLIIGDSRVTLPEYIKNNTTFDVIFIDGGHDYDIAKSDLENCFYLSHSDTIVIMDDTVYTVGNEKEYTIGPTKAWIEKLETNKIVELNRIEFSVGIGMSWGKYVLNN